jgi:transglutaminase/protease-like cytokinesis protein 3
MKKSLLTSIVCAVAIISFAQISTPKYKYIDDDVQKLGTFPTKNVAEIADAITAKFSSNEDKARAIFYWIANNIAIDPKAVNRQEEKNKVPEKVIETRKATPLGFSLLVQEMCSYAKIRCLSVDGFVKNRTSEINEKLDEKNYSWNVVQLGQSPETWYYIDACRASGFLDSKQKVFTKQFTSQYFFADKKLFNLIYFPDNMAWMLGGGNKSMKDFYALPIIGNEAIGLEFRKLSPLTGVIKTVTNKAVDFSFSINNDNTIKKISILIGDEKKKQKEEPMNFDDNNGDIKFSYTFKKEDTFPIQIVADGKIVLQYIVEVKEAKEVKGK